MTGGYYYNVGNTLAAFLIEILTLYKGCSDQGRYWQMYSGGSRVYIPKAKKKFVHFKKEYKYDRKFKPAWRDKRALSYRKGFSGLPLIDAINRVIKGCRLYLCNSDAVDSNDKYCIKKYKQYCKKAGKDYHNGLENGRPYDDDDEYYDCINAEYQYSLEVLSYIIGYVNEEE